jgi:hypothetical protein
MNIDGNVKNNTLTSFCLFSSPHYASPEIVAVGFTFLFLFLML